MSKIKSRAVSKVLNWQVAFNGTPGSVEWSVVLTEQPSGRILDSDDLKVRPGDSIVITSASRGGKDFVAQWNILLSTAAINDKNPGLKTPMLDWGNIGWLPLNLKKTGNKPSIKFGFHSRGVTYLQLKYCDQPAGGQKLMFMGGPDGQGGQQNPNKVPTSDIMVRITIVVS